MWNYLSPDWIETIPFFINLCKQFLQDFKQVVGNNRPIRRFYVALSKFPAFYTNIYILNFIHKIRKLIKKNSLKNRQFQEYLRGLKSEHSDIFFMLKLDEWVVKSPYWDFGNWRRELNFHEQKWQLHDQWLRDLCFLTDITITKPQGLFIICQLCHEINKIIRR